MEATTREKFKSAVETVLPHLRFRPISGKLWLDALCLLVVGALHFTIIPTVTGSWLAVDVMTPWLITVFVVEKLPRAALIGFIGSIILETHSTTPAGMYLCSYWVMLCVLQLTRATLSWRHLFPWVVTFLLGEIWVIGFETFVGAVYESGYQFDWKFFSAKLARVLASMLIGLALSHRFRTLGLAEEEAVV
jgi:hypothetical protein